MALKFHYNRTIIQQFRAQLSIREKALVILKSKETALRKEEEELARRLELLNDERKKINTRLEGFKLFWSEFPSIVTLEDPGIYEKKVVGVKIPESGKITFRLEDVSWWNLPGWIPAGIDIMQQSIRLDIQLTIANKQMMLLNTARKKTTQKVNLYEKVQIPAYEEAILKIKRFLEDQENISKAGQKIVKKKRTEAA